MTVSEVFEPVSTERLVLRGYRADDVDDLLRYYSRREVCRFLFDDPWTIEHARKVVQRKVSRRSLSDGYLALVVEYEGRVVGNVGAWLIEGTEHSAELGWVFSPEVAGKGLATEAVTALLDLVFATPSLHRVRAQMDARNDASARLARRVGMRREAHFREDMWVKGEWTDTVVFAVLVDEWSRTSCSEVSSDQTGQE